MESKSKLTAAFSRIAAIFAALLGAMMVFITAYFHDFLVMYQFRPAVRPLYPVYYGAIAGAGAVIALLGIAAFILSFKKAGPKPGHNKLRAVVPIVELLVGIGLPVATIILNKTAGYLAADNLYLLIVVSAMTMGALVFLAMVPAALLELRALIKKEYHGKALQALAMIPLALMIMGATVFGVINLPPDAEKKPFPEDLPMAPITLYKQGDGGYNTFKIPTMIVAPDGTVLLFAEARTDSKEDWSKTDIVVRRSYDKGETWEPLEVLFAEGDKVFGNACPVVDRDTGFIHMLFCVDNYYVLKTHSEDNGKTWAEPVEITADVKPEGWTWYATGPSHGIQLRDGTLMIPADHIVAHPLHPKMIAHVLYSTDRGETWQLGGDVPGGEEAVLAELDDGSVYINVRPVKPGYRVTARSSDKGLSWDTGYDCGLPDPAVQGNLVQITSADGIGWKEHVSVYLFTNPADKTHRENMTIRYSDDDCQTWKYSRQLYAGMASYSALTVIEGLDAKGFLNIKPEDCLIGAAFECGANFYSEEIVFTRFALDYVTGPDNAIT